MITSTAAESEDDDFYGCPVCWYPMVTRRTCPVCNDWDDEEEDPRDPLKGILPYGPDEEST